MCSNHGFSKDFTLSGFKNPLLRLSTVELVLNLQGLLNVCRKLNIFLDLYFHIAMMIHV